LGLLRDLSVKFPDLDIHYVSTGSYSKKQIELEEELKKKDEEIEFQRSIVKKFAMPGKTEGAIIRPVTRDSYKYSSAHQVVKRAFGKKEIRVSDRAQGTCVPSLPDLMS